MIFDIQAISEKGPIRSINEDAIRYGQSDENNCFWMVIADGMGGHKAGEVASHMFVEYIEQSLKRNLQIENNDWQKDCEKIFLEANKEIYSAAQTNSEYEGMGTTGVLLVCSGQKIHVSWVGDSRAYRFRKSELQQLTQDHTMIQYLLDKGAITEVEAARSNTKHLLSRAIGIKQNVLVDYLSYNAEVGDVYLLSTDGIHDFLAEAVIAGYLSQVKSGRQISRALVKDSVAQGSKDNLSAGIITLKQSED